uniref:Uncharacterized protein n=1 Tax=viral metagenome TaxID=1070528 RepID=A0A6C0ANS6_9ZZZZ
MEDISSMWKYCIFTLFAIGVLVLLYRFFYIIDGFDSDPLAGRTPCDPTCSGFGHSKVSGRPCCHDSVGQVNPTSQADCPNGTTFDSTAKQCLVCTTLENGKTECHSAGAYDAKPNFTQGSIDKDTVKTDVLKNPATTVYSDWATDSKTNSYITHPGADSSFLDSQYRDNNIKSISESDGDKPYDTIEVDYDNLINERNFSYDYDDDDTSEEAYSKLKNNRFSAQELIDLARKRAAYRDSRIYGRYMERPSEISYYDNDLNDYDDTEGFAARL